MTAKITCICSCIVCSEFLFWMMHIMIHKSGPHARWHSTSHVDVVSNLGLQGGVKLGDAHLQNSSNRKAHASLNCSFQSCIWHKLSYFETHCLILRLSVWHCKATLQVFNKCVCKTNVFSLATHCIQAKQSCILDRSAKLPAVKNAMYLASLQLLEQITTGRYRRLCTYKLKPDLSL